MGLIPVRIAFSTVKGQVQRLSHQVNSVRYALYVSSGNRLSYLMGQIPVRYAVRVEMDVERAGQSSRSAGFDPSGLGLCDRGLGYWA